eukprot:g12301.t1
MVKTSPDGRFRFVKGGSGGSGGTAYDTENGLLVGWNELNLRGMSANERSSTARSIDLLQGLSHDHVLGVRSYWEASKPGSMERPSRSSSWQAGETGSGQGERVVFLTTPCITLEAFVETKVEFLRWRVVKRWSRQILEALRFLHQQSPPVVHKNLSLSTIYIDPSKSHIFVGGVRDIIAPSPQSPTKQQQQQQFKAGSSSSRGGGGGGGGDRRPKSWGGRAWGLVASGRMGRGKDIADKGVVGFDDDDDDNESWATEEDRGVKYGEAEGEGCGEDEEEKGPEDGEEGVCGGARDIRAFATTLIEMVLKRRLDPALARDERFLEMLPVISGWPVSVVDLLRSCRAPADERPSAYELLQHPFFELGKELDDQPVYGDAELIAVAFAAATALRSSEDGSGHGNDLAGAAAAASAVAAANGNVTPQSARYLRPPSPAPILMPQYTPGAGAGAAGAAPQTWGALAASGVPSSRGPLRSQGGDANCDWSSPDAYGYTPSCSTDSPSPSSPSAAPCFGGVPTTPSSPPAEAPLVSTSSFSSAQSASTASSRVGHHPDFGGAGARHGGGPPESFSSVVLPAGVTPAAVANAAAIAAQMQQQQQQQQQQLWAGARSSNCGAPSYPMPPASGGHGLGEGEGRNRSGTYPNHAQLTSGGEAGVCRARSASEDAVWDMLPSDESQCRRPFSVSAVEGRHGY